MDIELQNIFQKANNLFLKNEKTNLLRNVSERNLCGNLKTYFEHVIKKTEFRNYYVDIEYNRNDEYVKAILNDDLKKIPITCDLIIHSRGELEKDNLLCLEMKKSTASKAAKQKDKDRLIALTRKPYDGVWSYDGKVNPEYVCDYTLGIYYEINIKKGLIDIEYYNNGVLVKKENINIMEGKL